MASAYVTNLWPIAIYVGTTLVQPGDTPLLQNANPDELKQLAAEGKIRYSPNVAGVAGVLGTGGRSYSATLTAPAGLLTTATDIAALSGFDGGFVLIKKIIIAGAASGLAALASNPSVVRRAALPTGGTPTNPVPVQHDTSSPAAQAKAWQWATPPVVGAQVGSAFRTFPLPLLPPLTGAQPPLVLTFSDVAQAPILRSSTESIAIALTGATLAATMTVSFEWQELAAST